MLTNFEYKGDLKTNSKLNNILSKLPPDLKGKWIFFSIEKKFSQPNVNELSEWLTDEAVVHNQIIA